MDSSLRLWESLRADVRQVDQILDQLIAQLESLANINEDNVEVGHHRHRRGGGGGGSGTSPAPPPLVSGRSDSGASFGNGFQPRRTLAEVQQQFDEVRANVEANMRHYERQLQAMVDASAGSLTSTRHTERFQGLFQEKRRNVQRIHSDFQRRKEHLELLPSISVDLKNYEDETGTRLLMEEQDAIRHTHGRVHQILEQAAGTQTRLQNQRERFLSMGDRLVQLAERIPVIQQVLKRIDSRRRVHVVVLGTVLSCCIFLTVLFW